ncbi:MAG: antibiotic biosynthesis monooxygenase, partial [Salegentibacter sp.]
DEAALENYRNSELFKEVWAKTKVFFNDRPEAWSVDKVWSSE